MGDYAGKSKRVAPEDAGRQSEGSSWHRVEKAEDSLLRTCITRGGMQREEPGEGRKEARARWAFCRGDGGAALTWRDGARLRDTQLPKKAIVPSIIQLGFELARRASSARIKLRQSVTLSAKTETAATVGSRTLHGQTVRPPTFFLSVGLSDAFDPSQSTSRVRRREDVKTYWRTAGCRAGRHGATRRNCGPLRCAAECMHAGQ
jgi:hypothetical protein